MWSPQANSVPCRNALFIVSAPAQPNMLIDASWLNGLTFWISVKFRSLGGCPANTAYALNTKYMFYQPHKDRNFTEIQKVNPFNQDASITMFGWAGALTMNNAFLQGTLFA